MSEALGTLPTVTTTATSTFVVITDTVTSEKIAISDLQKLIRPYAVYTALMNQAGVGNPVATVQENTLSGAIVWTYVSDGVFNGQLVGAFATAAKVWMPNAADATGTTINFVEFTRLDNDNIKMRTFVGGGALANSLLKDTAIEIRVYN